MLLPAEFANTMAVVVPRFEPMLAGFALIDTPAPLFFLLLEDRVRRPFVGKLAFAADDAGPTWPMKFEYC